jgi:uncharacterized protein (DUF885 family)
MLNYEDYFNDIIKINSQMSYIIKKSKVFKHFTNTLSNDHLNNFKKIIEKYENTEDIELKRVISFEKQYIKYKVYLYLPITSYENEIIIFNTDNEKTYPKKYKNERQSDFHEYVRTIIKRLNEGLEQKISIPHIIVKKLLMQFKELEKYQYLYKYLKNNYLSKCTKKIGLCNLPNGKKLYKLFVKDSVDKTPEYVHKLGLSLLAKIKTSNTKEKYYKSKEAFYKDCVEISLHIYNDIIDKYFYYKPDKPFTIKKVLSSFEDSFPLAYYNHFEDSVFINLKYYDQCSKKSIYSLLLHECFHQYHYSFMKYHKLKDYQVFGYNNLTMIEGFAHYIEIYNDFIDCDDCDNYFSILRKVRLVADTGINYYNWSYKKTYNFMLKYLPNNSNDIINEIDRYICMPSQALCYTIGKLEIIKMRDAFLKKNKDLTIKDFHHRLLINGTCSLSTIKKIIL